MKTSIVLSFQSPPRFVFLFAVLLSSSFPFFAVARNLGRAPAVVSSQVVVAPEYKFDQRMNDCYNRVDSLSRRFLPQDNDHAFQYLGGGAFARGPLAADDKFWHLALGDHEVLVDMKTGSCTNKAVASGGMTMQKFVEEKLASALRAFRAQLDALKENGSDAVADKVGLEKFEADLKKLFEKCQSVAKNENGDGPPAWLKNAIDQTRSNLRPMSIELHSGLGGPSTGAAVGR